VSDSNFKQREQALRTASLDIDKVDVVGGSVDHGPEGHRVGDLTVEPYVLIGGESPGELWSNHTNDVSQHREEDETTVIGEDEACTPRRPNGDLQGVEARKLGVGCLLESNGQLSSSCLATTANGGSLANTTHRRRGRGGYRKRRR